MTDDDIDAFALKHDLTVDQARQVLDAHRPDEGRWSDGARNLIHFLKAPS